MAADDSTRDSEHPSMCFRSVIVLHRFMHLCFLLALPLTSLSGVQTSSTPPPPPSISPPLSHRPSSVLAPVVFHSMWTEHLSTLAPLTFDRPVFALRCRGVCVRAGPCVCAQTSFIAFQTYLGIAVHPKPTIAP